MIESKTDQEFQDEYINYFAFLLEPLSFLSVEVADEIRRMPEQARVFVTPIDH